MRRGPRRPENDIEDGVLLLLASTHFYFLSFVLGMKSPVLLGFIGMYYSVFILFKALKELNFRFHRRGVDSQTSSEATSEATSEASSHADASEETEKVEEAEETIIEDDDKTDPDMPKLVPYDELDTDDERPIVSDDEDDCKDILKIPSTDAEAKED